MLELFTKQTAIEKAKHGKPIVDLKRKLMLISQKIRERKIPVDVVAADMLYTL
jgi:hypothetical protein